MKKAEVKWKKWTDTYFLQHRQFILKAKWTDT